jgi:parallel beta-helix repeat protein
VFLLYFGDRKMRRHVFGLVVIFLLVEILPLASNIRLARSESATIVVPDAFLAIQEAINSAVEGDIIFVRTGTYYEHVVVNKSVSLVGEDSRTTIIDGNETGRVIDVVSDNVNVTGFTVQRGGSITLPDLDAGICLDSVRGCKISSNNIVDNGCFGIHLLNSDQNTVSGNNLTRNALFAIELSTSNNNVISSNIAAYNPQIGIGMHASSHDNAILGNIVINNTYGINLNNLRNSTISGNYLANNSEIGIWMQNDVVSNAICGNNVTASRYCIKIEERANNNTIWGNILTDSQSSIHIQNAKYTEIFNNTIAHNYGGDWDAGIRLDSAGYSSIYSNLIVDNWRGILLYASSPRASIYSNNISDNEFAVRVASGGSNYLRVFDNTVMNNRGYGIGLTGFGGASNYATISRNLIANNSDGITLGQNSNYNTILQNNISQNGYGFYIESSTQNTIRENTIVDNAQQVYVSTGSINNWDGGYPTGGNYWSDYHGTDLLSGPNQNETGSDGIGDSSHGVNSGPQTPPELVQLDNYPLMGPFHSFNTSAGERVNTISNSTLEGFECEPLGEIRFYVANTTSDQIHGFCRVNIPYEVLSDPFNVTVNGANPTYWNFNLYDNGTHRWIYFEYEHSTREVVIISELPIFTILLLLMTFMLWVLLAKKMHASPSSSQSQTLKAL